MSLHTIALVAHDHKRDAVGSLKCIMIVLGAR